MSKFVAYLRTSTAKESTGQTTDTQRVQIESAGFKIDKYYVDEGISGGVNALERPAFIKMMDELGVGTTLIVVEVSRIGRNVSDVIKMTDLFIEKGIKLVVLQFGNLDLTSPIGVAMLQMSSVFSALERSMIKTRVKAGLDRTRKEGTILGKPSTISPAVVLKMKEDKSKGKTNLQISMKYDVSLKTVAKYLAFSEEDVVEYKQQWEAHQKQLKANKLK